MYWSLLKKNRGYAYGNTHKTKNLHHPKRSSHLMYREVKPFFKMTKYIENDISGCSNKVFIKLHIPQPILRQLLHIIDISIILIYG